VTAKPTSRWLTTWKWTITVRNSGFAPCTPTARRMHRGCLRGSRVLIFRFAAVLLLEPNCANRCRNIPIAQVCAFLFGCLANKSRKVAITPGYNNYRQTVSQQAGLSPLLQLRILRFGFFQDGNIGIGVGPRRVRSKCLTGISVLPPNPFRFQSLVRILFGYVPCASLRTERYRRGPRGRSSQEAWSREIPQLRG
jgi:hypothetical protein